jgi:hypothetical protein
VVFELLCPGNSGGWARTRHRGSPFEEIREGNLGIHPLFNLVSPSSFLYSSKKCNCSKFGGEIPKTPPPEAGLRYIFEKMAYVLLWTVIYAVYPSKIEQSLKNTQLVF